MAQQTKTAIFDSNDNWIAIDRAAAAGETSRTIGIDAYDVDASPGNGHWDAAASRIVANPAPASDDIEALEALYVALGQLDAWKRELLIADAAVTASGFRYLDAARQALRRIWTDSTGDDGRGSIALADKTLVFTALTKGALDVPDVRTFIGIADLQRTAPTRASLWVGTDGTRLNLAASHDYGPLNAAWKSYDDSWAVTRTHSS